MRLDSHPPSTGATRYASRRTLIRPRNVAPLDRFLRIAIGAGLLAVVFAFSGEWRWLGLAGVLPLASGLAGWCPVYAWLTRDQGARRPGPCSPLDVPYSGQQP